MTPHEQAELFPFDRFDDLPRVIRQRLRTDYMDHWIWVGRVIQERARKPSYGQIVYRADGKMHYKRAHVRVWELLVGPVQLGYVLDHLCREPLCCRPSHLEPVTPPENTRRHYRPPILIRDADGSHVRRSVDGTYVPRPVEPLDSWEQPRLPGMEPFL